MSPIATRLFLMCGKCWVLCGDEGSQPVHVCQALDFCLFLFKRKEKRQMILMQSNITQFCCSCVVCGQASSGICCLRVCSMLPGCMFACVCWAGLLLEPKVGFSSSSPPHRGNGTCPAVALHTHCIFAGRST